MKTMLMSRRTRSGGRSVRFGILAILCSALVSLGFLPARASAAANAAPCNSSFDPYHYSPAALQACGFHVFARTSVLPLPNGGTRYNYMVDGHLVGYLVPPAGFHPSTASNSRLLEYGFPERPANPAARSLWMNEMMQWKGTPPAPPFLVETLAQAHTTYSSTWAGYMVSSGNGTYKTAQAWYPEPTFYSSSCSSNAAVTWVGVGGWNDTLLAQDGTSHGVPGIGNHQAWWEVWPDVNMMPISLYGHRGYLFQAFTKYINPNWHFYMYDYYTGTSVSFDVPISGYSGNSGEAIIERPTINGTKSHLSNFKTMTFSQTEVNGKAISSYSASGPRYGVHMENFNNGDDLADPSGISSGGYFTVSQHHCN